MRQKKAILWEQLILKQLLFPGLLEVMIPGLALVAITEGVTVSVTIDESLSFVLATESAPIVLQHCRVLISLMMPGIRTRL